MSKATSRILVCLLLLVVVGIVAGARHSEPPRPPGPPPPPPEPVGRKELSPLAWSWAHWWEVNADRFLIDLRQAGVDQGPDQETLAADRARVRASLESMLKHPSQVVADQAALAIGRIGDARSLTALRDAAQARLDSGRISAIIAIGMLGGPGDGITDTLIQLDQQMTDARENAAIAVAFGLYLRRHPDPAVLEAVQRVMAGSNGAVSCAAAFAWATTAPATESGEALDVVASHVNPWVTGEVIERLDRFAPRSRRATIGLLDDLLNATPRGQSAKSWAYVEKTRNDRELLLSLLNAQPTLDRQRDARSKLEILEERWQASYPRFGAADQQASDGTSFGRERRVIWSLRTSAAVALGRLADDPAASRSLSRYLNSDREDSRLDLMTRAHALLGMAEHDQADRPIALEHLLPIADTQSQRNRRVRKQPEELQDPLRGFATIGLGLYCRPVETAQGPADRPRIQEIAEFLAARASDSREPREIRGAAIVALGLTARSENLRYLLRISADLGDDTLLTGYMLLARGMLADENIIEPAERFLLNGSDSPELAEMMGRRAAILGLASLRTERVIPVLVNAWDGEFLVNRVLPLAFSMLDAYSLTDQLIEILEDHESEWARAFAARCLGRLYARDELELAGEATLFDTNFTFRKEVLEPAQFAGKTFFIQGLVPALDEVWE